MIALYYVEKVISNTSTNVIDQACDAKIITIWGGADVKLYDGSATGRLVARLRGTTNNPISILHAGVNECFNFSIRPFAVVNGADAIVGLYLMGNPVGPQGP